MKKIVVIEKLPESFYKLIDVEKYDIYDLSKYFKDYKSVKDKKGEKSISAIAKEIANDLDKDFSKSVDCFIFRTKLLVDEELIKYFENIKLIIRAGSGYDNIDLDYCYDNRICFQNTPRANAISATEHTFSLIFGALKKIKLFDNYMREGKWRGDRNYHDELFDSTVMIIGYGRIGKQIMKGLSFFGVKKIYIYDPYLVDENQAMFVYTYDKLYDNETGVEFISNKESLHKALHKSNIITFHVPLWEETYNFINKDFLSNIKSDAIIVNTSRGEILNQDDLIEVLKENEIGCYAADVFANEPVYENIFKGFEDQTLLTPHVGAYTFSAKQRLCEETYKTITEFFEKDKIHTNIDKRFFLKDYFIKS